MKTIRNVSAAIALAFIAAQGLSGCAPVGIAAGAGATVGVAAAQEGGLKGATTDASIRVAITDLWLKQGFDLYRRLSMTVKEGRVLITGSVPTPDMRVDAVRLAWQADGVKQVINEITIENDAGVKAYVTDSWITSDLKTHMMFDKYVQSINYSIETVNGTVFLMGIAQDQKELDRVLDYARNTKYVKNVVSYVRLRGETPPGLVNPETGAPSNSVTN
ncbi:MAG: BON domain-containing protein [Micavibrio sp.]|nr:BON domain-containing protein [Micavibrio sp.]